MKKGIVCAFMSSAIFSNVAFADLHLSEIDDLSYQPYQVMTEDEMKSTKGRAIPAVLIPVLWGMAGGASVNVVKYLIDSAHEGRRPELRRMLFGAVEGGVTVGLLASVPALGGPMSTQTFRAVILEGGAYALFKKLDGYLFDDRPQHKIGPSLNHVPTNENLLRLLDDPNWADNHLRSIPGLNKNGQLEQVMEKALNDPQSWDKFTATRCNQCH